MADVPGGPSERSHADSSPPHAQRRVRFWNVQRDVGVDSLLVHAVASKTSRGLSLSHRDRRIVDLALTKVHGVQMDFGEAMRALREAAEELIPGGRVFLLGSTDSGPIVGSLLSGVGIVECEQGIQLVHVRRNGDRTPMGWFAR